uniref:Uncharacterized protein n=1 Tax=Avena sativa TaxID=4498 RepID=A0ACD5ZJB6_AVESA
MRNYGGAKGRKQSPPPPSPGLVLRLASNPSSSFSHFSRSTPLPPPMASPAGNPNPNPNNPNPPFEMSMLFRPPPNPAAPMFTGVAGPPPPSGPYSYPPATPPFHHVPYPHYAQDPHPPMPRPVMSYAMPNPNANPNPSANPGARLMQLLGNAGSGHLETAVSMPPPSSDFAATQPLQLPVMPSAPPARMLSTTTSKVPRGRLLGAGDKAVHNVDSRLPGEAQPPQLEVTPITKYTSDPGLVLGRQIAVNRTYIVYGLKMGNIRVLNINTALRSLLRGHTQRVTDMAFFADDVHRLASASVDGRIYVWRIDEGTDEENKPQISGKIEVAIQIVGDAEAYHPRICWHSHKQELLFVGIRNCVLRIDTTKVGKGRDFNTEEPIKCHLDELIDGVRLVGKHDGDVTDLSISQWMTTRLASGSKDGTVKIWDDRKPVPLSVLKPHDGQAVYSVAFLTAPERPHHINLITAGPLNREIKIWASTNEEGWLFPSETETWNCTQTLELISSLEPKVEEAFFNQVAVLPQASIILLANAKKNAIYAVHVEYGPDPASTRLDYIADFTVAMPILSLTGTHEGQPDGEQVVQVYCVQTMAIQQYGLELSLCSPPTSDTTGLGRDPAISRVHDTPLEVVGADSSTGTSFTDSFTVGASSKQSTFDQTTEFDHKPSAPPLAYTEGDGSAHLPSAPLASNTDLTGSGPSPGNRDKDQSAFDYPTNRSMEPVALTRQDTPMPKPLALTRQDTPMPKDTFGKDELRDSHSDVKMLPNPRMMFKDGSVGSPRIAEVEAKPVDESKSGQGLELEAIKEAQADCESSEKAQNLFEQTVEIVNERSVTTDKYSVEESRPPSDRLVPDHIGAAGENVLNKSVEMPARSDYSSVSREQSSTKEKVLHLQASGQSSPSTSAFNSTESSHEIVTSAYPPIDSSSEVADMQNMLQQDVLRTSFESLLVPAFEQSCKTMFEQVDSAFQKGMSEHAVAIQQQVEAGHTPLVLTLKETITSASSITQSLTSELLDGHRKLLALVTSGNANAQNTNVLQPNNGPITGPPEVEAPLDPMKELGRLISEHKFDEAFTVALQRSDVSIVSWLCSQVDLRALCTMAPVPLNQGVLLALLQQLAVDIYTETSRKIQWMTDVAMAINPTDQVIAAHVRPIFEQVYAKLAHHRSLPTTNPSDSSNLRLLMHVINSVLLSYK